MRRPYNPDIHADLRVLQQTSEFFKNSEVSDRLRDLRLDSRVRFWYSSCVRPR